MPRERLNAPSRQQVPVRGSRPTTPARWLQTSARRPPVLVPPENSLARQVLARNGNGPTPGQPWTLILYEENEAASEKHAWEPGSSLSGRDENFRPLDSHRYRAKLLSRTIPNSVTASVSRRQPVSIKNLSRIVFWGHGAPDNFCGYKPADFAKLLDDWRALNPTLQRIDMPTCNVQHYESRDTGPLGVPYVEALKPELHRRQLIGRQPGDPGLDIRTVPRSAHGAKDMMSKLFWDQATATWAYATGSVKKVTVPETGASSQLFGITQGLLTPGATKQAEYKQRPDFEEGLTWRAKRAIADKEVPEGSSIVYGTVDKLMDLLVPL